MPGRLILRLAGFAVLLGAQTACLEGFGALRTVVRYDAGAQRYQVERELRGVGPGFFGCHDLAGCAQAIGRAARLQSAAEDRSLADRLAQRVAESGAEDVRVELSRRGDALDVRVHYGTVVGTRAAADTLVRPEWGGKRGRESYRLVVDAEASMGAPPKQVELRRVPVDAEGAWRTSWVFGPRVRQVDWTMAVGDELGIFAQIPGLDQALTEAGLLGAPPEARAEPERRVRPEPAERPARAARPERAEPGPEVPAGQPTVFTYAPRVEGALPAEVAASAGQALLPGFLRCQQQLATPAEGYLFADAVVRSDGWVLSTSLYGEVRDPQLLACLAVQVDGWAFAAWAGAEGATAYVSVPFAFRAGSHSSMTPR